MTEKIKNAAAVMLGKLGGEARARKLTKERLKEISIQGNEAKRKKAQAAQ